ncbi:unnamed protein product [Blepharisma stoltei]|uniref:Uncharacterized protein n=1 Tax=Blepharisma stoltei TaxID=1481888 RepID=A0AAU9IKD0_9CILI|nr:unnamed protein product [Blepharisma stoltei]
MHPRSNADYQKKLILYFDADYTKDIIKKQGSEDLDTLYEELKHKKPWKSVTFVFGLAIPIMYIEKNILKVPREKSWIRRYGSRYVHASLALLMVGWVYETIIPFQRCSLDMALKYEDQLLKLHPDLNDYYTRSNFESPLSRES